MKDLAIFYDQLKSLYDDELYDDVKLLSDLLIGYIDAPNTNIPIDQKGDKYMIYFYYGNAAFNLKEYKLAESLLNKSLQANNKATLKPKAKTLVTQDKDVETTIKYNLHLCLLNEKKYQEAFYMLESVPHKQRTAKILLALGKLNQKLSNYKEAINSFKELIKNSKFSLIAIDALLNLGVKLDEIPKLPAALNVEWLNLYINAKTHFYQREYKDAIQTYIQIDLNFVHKSCEILNQLAMCQYLNGEHTNALNTFDRLHRNEPLYTNNMDIYAYLLHNDKSDRDKLSQLERLATDLHSISLQIPETWLAMGYFQLKKKPNMVKTVFDSIKSCIENALAIDSENTQALFLRAITYSKVKTPSETINAYREVTRTSPHFYEAYKGHVEALINTSQIKEAIQVAGACLKQIGHNHRTYTLMGEALSKEPSTQEKAKTYLTKALKIDSDNQEAVICLVRVCMALKNFDEALDVLGKYIRHNSSNSRLLQTYIELLKKFKRNDEAIVYLNKLVGSEPSNLEIRKLLERFEQSMETNQNDTIESI